MGSSVFGSSRSQPAVRKVTALLSCPDTRVNRSSPGRPCPHSRMIESYATRYRRRCTVSISSLYSAAGNPRGYGMAGSVGPRDAAGMTETTPAIGGSPAPGWERREDRTTSSAEFGTVDGSADPGGLIRFLDAANTVSGLRAAKDALLEQLALGRARAALDVGCGAGGDVAQMASLMPDGARVSGLDISEAMIAEARQRTASLGTRVCLRIGDAADLPYDDQGFDACRAATVLQHVPDPARVVSEMARVTRPGGRVGALEFDQETLFLDHPDPDTTRVILDTFAGAMVQGHIGRQLPR